MSPGFAEIAGRLLDNGYTPIPVMAGEKRPAMPDADSSTHKLPSHILTHLFYDEMQNRGKRKLAW